ncbi:MAG TPA: hypothetical protein VGB93_12595, partial [Methylovirgula sp.]
AKHGLRRIRSIGEAAIAEGKASKIFTRKLRRRFLSSRNRNFSSYARNSAKAFRSKGTLLQIRRFERMVEIELAQLNNVVDETSQPPKPQT